MKRAQIKFCELRCIFLSSIWATCKQMRDVPTVKESDLLMITQPPRDRPFGSSWRSNTNNSNLKEKKILLLVLKRDFGTISRKKKHLEGVVKAGIENKRQIINIFYCKNASQHGTYLPFVLLWNGESLQNPFEAVDL